MSISRVLAGIGLLLLTVLVAIVLYLQFADLSRHQPQVENQVSKLVGREFKINGAMQLELLPAPSLLLEQLSLANADWGSEPLMAEVGHAAARVNLWSLLSGPIQVESFELREVVLLLESNADGESNWDLSDPNAPATDATEEDDGDEEFSLPLMVHLLDIENILLTLRQAEQDDQLIRVDELSLQPNDAGNLGLTGRAEIFEQSLTLSGEIGPREQLEELGRADFALSASFGQIELQADGQIADLEHLSGSKLKAELRTAEVVDVIKQAGLALPFSGPLQLSAELVQTEQGAQIKLDTGVNEITAQAELDMQGQHLDMEANISPLDKLGTLFEVAALPAGALALNGALSMGDETIELEQLIAQLGDAEISATGTLATGEGESKLELLAKGTSMAELMTQLPTIPFDANAVVSLSPTLVTVDPLQLQFGDSDLAGKLAIELEETTSIDAELNSKKLDLRPFQESLAEELEQSGDGQTPEQAPAEQAPAEQEEEEKSEYVFVDEPLPFDTLQQTDADFDLSIEQLLTEGAELEQVKLVGDLHDGDLAATLAFDTPAGGRSASEIKLTTSGKQARLKANIGARDLRLNIASGQDAKPEQVPPISLTLELNSAGNTPRKLASSANGRVIMTQGAGQVQNELLGAVSGDILAQLFSALNPLAKDEEYSNWECSIIAVNIIDGESKIDAAVLQGEKIMIVGGGHIDLNTEKMKIEFNTKPREGIGISADMFVTPFVALRGTLASPSVGLNETGALLTTGAAFATGGLSLIVQGAADRATAEIDHCKKTLPKYPHPPL